MFHQTFPFQGKVKETLSYLKQGNDDHVLSQEITEYTAMNHPYDGSIAVGNKDNGGIIRFIHLETSDSYEYAYNTSGAIGGALPNGTLADIIFPDRNFVGHHLKTDSVTDQAFSVWGDLVDNVSQIEGSGEVTTNNQYQDPQISDPENIIVESEDVVVPVAPDAIFGK